MSHAQDRNHQPGGAPQAPREVFVHNPLRREFKRAVRRDLDDLYGFYIDGERRDKLSRMGRFKRAIYLVGWVLKSMFLKLTPARRTLLLISLTCFYLGKFSFDRGDVHISFNFYILTIMILLFIVMLELKDKLLVRDEIEAGRAVQLALLPLSSPEVPGWRIWLWSRPANDVGGDLADYLWLSETRMGLALGDVAGKGLGAALLMAKLQATLRAIAPDYLSLVELGARINRIICRDCDPTRFATLIYAELESDSDRVRILNAGHPPPIAMHADGIHSLPPAALPIGLMTDAVYMEQQIEVRAGDVVVLYSDGVTEACNGDGAFFGEDRLYALLPSLRGLSSEALGRRIIAEVDRFMGDARVSDDLSLVILERL